MSRLPRTAWAVVAVLAVAGACSQFGSSTNEDAAPDGGSDATPADAPVDALTADAPGDDGGADCAEPFQFFETFDTDPSLAVWMPTAPANGLYLVTDSLPNAVAPVSPPNAFFASGSLPDAGDSVHVSILERFDFAPAHARLTYALYVPSITPFAEVGCAVRIGGNPFATPVTLDVIAVNGALAARRLDIDGGGPQNVDLGPVPAAAFTNLAIVVTTSVETAMGTATIERLGSDGTVSATANLGSFQLPAAASRLEVECGIGVANLGGASTGNANAAVAIDEVALRTCKR